MKKRKTVLLTLFVSVVLFSLIAITYAFFGTTVSGNPNQSANLTAGTMKLTFADKTESFSGTLSLNESITKEFSITNKGSIDGKVTLNFVNLKNTYTLGSLVYGITQTTSGGETTSIVGTVDGSGNLVSGVNLPVNTSGTGIISVAVDNIQIPANASKNNEYTYKIIIKFQETGEDQTADLNATFYTEFGLEENYNKQIMAIYIPDTNEATGYRKTTNMTIPEGYMLDEEKTSNECDGGTFTWDKATRTYGVSATKPLKCDLYLKKASIATCLDGSGNEISCPSTFSIGDRIAIGDEVFRFIRYTSTSGSLNECGGESGTSTACGDATNGDIRALAEYNLYVGRYYTASSTYTDITKSSNPSEYGKQNSSAIGWQTGGGYPRIGTTPFSSADVKGTNYSSYTGSIVEDYVEEYVQYLSDEYDATVSGGLITKAELEYLECSSSSYSCSSSSYPWVYTTSYWSGSPYNTYSVWRVDSSGIFNDNFYSFASFGVRPVITISKSDI